MSLFDIKIYNYTLPKKARKDEDIVESYFQSFLVACEEFKKLK